MSITNDWKKYNRAIASGKSKTELIRAIEINRRFIGVSSSYKNEIALICSCAIFKAELFLRNRGV